MPNTPSNSSLSLAVLAAAGLLGGCAGETGLESSAEPSDQVLVAVSGVVESKVGPLADAYVCSLYTPSAGCTRTDGAGAFKLDVWSAAAREDGDQMVALTLDADGYMPGLVPEMVQWNGDEAMPMQIRAKMVHKLEAAFAAGAMGVELDPDKGHVITELVRSDAPSSVRVWEGVRGFELRAGGTKAYYADEDGKLQKNASVTSSDGSMVFPNVEPGLTRIGLVSRDQNIRCGQVQGFGQDGKNRFYVDVVPGRITTTRALCFEMLSASSPDLGKLTPASIEDLGPFPVDPSAPTVGPAIDRGPALDDPSVAVGPVVVR